MVSRLKKNAMHQILGGSRGTGSDSDCGMNKRAIDIKAVHCTVSWIDFENMFFCLESIGNGIAMLKNLPTICSSYIEGYNLVYTFQLHHNL